MSIFKLMVIYFTLFWVVNAAQLLDLDSHGVIPGAYIVVMKNGVSSHQFSSHVRWLKRAHRRNLAKRVAPFTEGLSSTWDIAGWQAYSGSFDKDTIQEILNHENVEFVEPNREMKAASTIKQENITWGLARISHMENFSHDYVSTYGEGENLTFYGIDSGIDIHQSDFTGRARWGINVADHIDIDCIGHGTHTAGTVAGQSFGILKKASIVSVKVLDCYGHGDTTKYINGLNWAINDAKKRGLLGKSVMNISLGTGRSRAVNEATVRAQEAGIFISVAAGNNAINAEFLSPGSAPELCTVAASTRNDTRAYFSNYGALIDLFAPGEYIRSTLPHNRTGIMSGTSMAAPHVCGIGGLIMAAEGLAPEQVCRRLKELANPAIKYAGFNTTDKLLYNGSGA
ncbi:oryzin [Nannizzia gypsea CBS 118893]|uniref:Subtilisin-like protease 12 n=1 Tax=Arthroderma gypseum (strain ATCC MYA-4604 / CBS 118893) TaxID=535722 RepID=SUB12_ARTGP|nr:oryzin [Nannizzia gypsea CBS 118893]E4UY04.1 RecName: Full=Subtilisin-like protease 12; Flags: Precursor [Nannizzia gypsea CBS 118893]EFR01997.1 oryzin [Nannizzia gypsea CBS 118893]